MHREWKVEEARTGAWYHMKMPSGGIVAKFANKDDADLAAAAPEMLAALKEEVDCAREFDSSSSAYQRAQESLENIKAIIAKAEGDEHE